MEDSEGNLLNKEEIQYNIQEKKENEEQEKISSLLNNIDLNILKEKLNITDIQEPFISGSTNDLENLNIKYLLFNLTGMVISKIQNSIKTIEVKFSDNSNKKNISFIDGKDYSIVAMNETGIVFGNKVEELNIDEYEKENRRKNGSIEFKSIRFSNDNLLNDWIFDLPEEESVIILGNTDVIETTAAAQKSNSALKALGVMAGIGVAAGAAAYAAKEMKKSNNDSNDDDDYGYDSSTDGYY